MSEERDSKRGEEPRVINVNFRPVKDGKPAGARVADLLESSASVAELFGEKGEKAAKVASHAATIAREGPAAYEEMKEKARPIGNALRGLGRALVDAGIISKRPPRAVADPKREAARDAAQSEAAREHDARAAHAQRMDRIRQAAECDRCGSYGWSPTMEPEQIADGSFHHPVCPKVRDR